MYWIWINSLSFLFLFLFLYYSLSISLCLSLSHTSLINKCSFQVIDPIAPRYTTLETNPLPVNLKGVSESTLNVALHPKNPDVGSKTVHVAGRLLIDQVDAKTLKEGENATFINYGNIMIDKIHK